jgi:outer membrane protein TolC
MCNVRFWFVGVLALGLGAGGARADEAKDSRLKELLREKVAALKENAALVEKAQGPGGATPEQVLQAHRAVLDAELELCDTDKERIAVLEKTVALTKTQEETVRELMKKGAVTASAVIAARVRRLDAEIMLERTKARLQSQRESGKHAVEVAESDVQMWKERVEWAERMTKKGFITERHLQAEQDALKKAEAALKDARRQLDGPPKDKRE